MCCSEEVVVEAKSENPRWSICLFGCPRVAGNNVELTHFDTKRVVYLLARLALSQRLSLARNELADFLWPDDFYDATRLRLRQELTRLRRALGEARGILWSDAERIGLSHDDLEIDVRRFADLFQQWKQETDAAVREKCCREALSLSDGQLLFGFEEDWIEAERSRFSRMRYALLVDLAAICSSRGDHSTALDIARQAIELDPLREEGHLLAMRDLSSLGFVTDAIAQYQHLKSLLKSELSESPSEEVEAAMQALQQQKPTLAQFPQALAADPVFTIPAPAEPIYGRQEMVAHLSSLLFPDETKHRLITLRGPGGIGKSRLALQVALELQSSYEGKVGWISLADLSIPANIPQLLANALALNLGPGVDPLQTVIRLIGTRDVLLVMDNFEQLLPEGTKYVKSLLTGCPKLRLLVTSRIALKVSGERSVPLGPLPIPTDGDLLHQPSMMVFLEPLLAEQIIDQPTLEEMHLYREIVQRLEGIPLALQLASGRLRTMTAQDLKAQLERRLDLVNSNSDIPARHRTLRAALEGSFRSLPPDLQLIMGRLAVFRGGWNQSSASFACDLADPLPAMERLLDSSLIRVDREGKGLRFRMLETIREYTLGEMSEQELNAAHQKHADWLIAFCHSKNWRLMDTESLVFFDEIDAELDNVREAASFCLDHDLERATKLGIALGRFWLSRSLVREALDFYRVLFERLDPNTVTSEVAMASFCYALILYIAQKFAPGDIGYDVSLRTEELCRKTGLEVEATLCALHQSRTHYVAGDIEKGLELILGCQQRLKELKCFTELAQAVQTSAMMYYFQGRIEDAISGMEEATALLGHDRSPFHQVQTSMMLSFMYLETHELEKAKTQAYRALHLADHFRMLHFTPMIQEACGKVAQAEGDLSLAAEWFKTSAKNWDVFGNVYQYADQLNLLARVHLEQRDPEPALPLLKTAAGLLQERGMMAVVPCTIVSAAKAFLQLGRAALAARLIGAYDRVSATSRDGSLATEIAYVNSIKEELVGLLGSERVEEIAFDAPELEVALKEAFGSEPNRAPA